MNGMTTTAVCSLTLTLSPEGRGDCSVLALICGEPSALWERAGVRASGRTILKGKPCTQPTAHFLSPATPFTASLSTPPPSPTPISSGCPITHSWLTPDASANPTTGRPHRRGACAKRARNPRHRTQRRTALAARYFRQHHPQRHAGDGRRHASPGAYRHRL